MSQGERTEKATPKKRRDARERGEVLKSVELNTGLLIIIGFSALWLAWGYITGQCEALFIIMFDASTMEMGRYDQRALGLLFVQITARFVMIIAPILIVTVLAGLLVNYLQVGFLFTTKPLAPKFNRISPLSGFKRMFSSRSLAELLKSIAKVIIIVVMVNGTVREFAERLPLLMDIPLKTMINDTMAYAFGIGIRIGAALLAVGVADYLYQWWKHEKDMRMTKQEVKDEYKMSEGDPQVKGRIKQKQREMASMRMMQAVPDADVVITNPTHYAVALKYDEDKSDAPVVLAKGKDHVALKIKEIAREHRIDTVEDRPLAQSLYALCEVGDVIPEGLYHAVAEILAYIYRAKHPTRATGGKRIAEES